MLASRLSSLLKLRTLSTRCGIYIEKFYERKVEITEMKQHYSYQEIKASLTKKKNSRSSLWVQLWVRKASFPVTYLFINSGWTANMVSVLSWIVIAFAAVCLSINSFGWMLAGVILTNFWLVLDCVDGNIARVKKVKTFMGDFFDAVAGYGSPARGPGQGGVGGIRA